MSGVLSALAGASGATLYLTNTFTSGQASDGAKVPTYCTGYSDGTTDSAYGPVGSMTNYTYRGATIKGLFNTTYGGTVLHLTGNRAAGFVTYITLNGVVWNVNYGSYDSTNNYTQFTLAASLTTTTYTLKMYGI